MNQNPLKNTTLNVVITCCLVVDDPELLVIVVVGLEVAVDCFALLGIAGKAVFGTGPDADATMVSCLTTIGL